nr:Chain A, Major surface glycoprotein G [Human respiratory syncytial virus A2]5WNB_B Chain B, Major surface glycoprotein G [Human respiratory syncytial virus A2]
DFHFEVFNFVP